MKAAVFAMCCVAALAHGALRARQDGEVVETQNVKTVLVSETNPALEPDREDWVKPEYGSVRPATGATGGAEEAEDEEPLPQFKPKMVPHGHFSGVPEEEKHEPVKPKMVATGQLEAERRAEMEAQQAKIDAVRAEERAKEEAALREEQDFACRTIDSTRQLALALYGKEDNADGASKKMVLNLVNAVCPALKLHAAKALDSVDCEKLAGNIAKFYDDKYEGKVPQTQEAMCNGQTVEIRNYAVAQALHSANNFFDISFCAAPKAGGCAAGVTGATGAEDEAAPEEDAAEDAAGPSEEETDQLIAEADRAEEETQRVLDETQA